MTYSHVIKMHKFVSEYAFLMKKVHECGFTPQVLIRQRLQRLKVKGKENQIISKLVTSSYANRKGNVLFRSFWKVFRCLLMDTFAVIRLPYRRNFCDRKKRSHKKRLWTLCCLPCIWCKLIYSRRTTSPKSKLLPINSQKNR